jgi:hypothetical protein
MQMPSTAKGNGFALVLLRCVVQVWVIGLCRDMIMTITVAFAYLLCLFGVLVCAWGNLMFLAVVLRHSSAWFLGCLLVPFVDWIYFFFYLRRTWKPTLISIAGCLLIGIGCLLRGFDR